MIRIIHHTAFSAMIAGITLILQPWWGRGFAAGFAVTLVGTVTYIITSHLLSPKAP
jgi:hypothetical protein